MSLKNYKKKLNYNSKEIKYELVSKLNKLCKSLHEEYNINYGGCCYIAYCVARLCEYLEIEFNLIVFDDEYDLYDYSELDDLPTMSHYAILLDDSIEGEVINCDDFWFDYRYKRCFKVNSREILKYYLNHEPWNKRYNTKNNSSIRLIIEDFYYVWTKSLRKK